MKPYEQQVDDLRDMAAVPFADPRLVERLNAAADTITELAESLTLAVEHLDYCSYGDSWERECAEHHKLPDKLTGVITKYMQPLEGDDE